MTTEQRRALASYVRESADVLGLVEWKLILLGEKPGHLEPEVSGYCEVIFGHRCAHVWLESTLPTERRDWQRYTVVHELLHVPMQAPWWAWSRPCEELLGAAVFGAVTANAVTAWEATVDQLARAIGPMLDYPDWFAEPSRGWIGEPDEDGDLVLYSRSFHEAGHPRPLS